ncbi:MAG: hypothetical protein OXU67_01215 [Chloroflexota bacterium]|nr:hypothetical protein [Chloroflexota bacterium]
MTSDTMGGQWHNLTSIAMVEAARWGGDDTAVETRWTSARLTGDAAALLVAPRGH